MECRCILTSNKRRYISYGKHKKRVLFNVMSLSSMKLILRYWIRSILKNGRIYYKMIFPCAIELYPIWIMVISVTILIFLVSHAIAALVLHALLLQYSGIRWIYYELAGMIMFQEYSWKVTLPIQGFPTKPHFRSSKESKTLYATVLL